MSGSFLKNKEAREKCIVKTMSTLNDLFALETL